MDQELSAIDGLPNEILLIIFSNISCHQLNTSVSKVCRRWKHLVSQLTLRIMYDGDAVKMHGGLMALLVTNFVRTLPDASVIVYRVATFIPHLKELTLSEDYCLDVAQLKIIETLHNLRHLDIFTTKQNLNELTPIPHNVSSLVVNNNMAPGFLRKIEKQNRVIKAFHMYGRSTHCPLREIESFLKNYSVFLCELTLRCSELGDSSYETISQCKELTSLQMYSCSQLRFKGACHLTYLTKLRRLHVTGTRMIRTNSLMYFIKNLPPQIVDLNLSYSWFGDEHCSALLARLPNLRFLELWRSRVSVFHLVRLVEQLTSLEELDTDAIFLRGHIKFLNAHPSLKNIRCRWIDQIKTRFHIKSAEEKILAQYLRLDEEGPRGGLFYYWLQDASIRTQLSTPEAPVRRGSYLARRTSDFDLYEGPLFGNSRHEN